MTTHHASTPAAAAEAAAAVDAAGTTDVVVLDLDHAPAHACDPSVARRLATAANRGVVTIGVSSNAVDHVHTRLLESLTTTVAPRGPGRLWAPGDPQAVVGAAEANPVAASTLARTLHDSAGLGTRSALALESASYSNLLGSPEFSRWRSGHPVTGRAPATSPVALSRDGDVLTIDLRDPDRGNAFSRHMRDGLLEALELASTDDSLTTVRWTASGPHFCSGGDLDEFGTASSPAAAHLLRLRASVPLLLHRLRDRLRVELHGACIGAGIEMPAFAGRVVARPDTWFRLPELTLGLMPGAGGTVSIPRRIGRWRTAGLVLGGDAIDATTALDWGLVDEIA